MSCRGLLELSDLIPTPLSKVVAIWNDVTETEALSLHRDVGDCLTVDFTQDEMWAAWGSWVFSRCAVSSDEKLLEVLYKVCKISAHCVEADWAKTFYRDLLQLVTVRIEQCTEDDMRKRLEKFLSLLGS